jgi:hypothetical protein
MESAIVEQAPAAKARAASERVESPRLEDSVAVSYSTVDYESSHYGFSYETLGLANNVWFAPGFEAGVGMRAAVTDHLKNGHAFESFVTLSVAPRFPTLRDDAGRMASWAPTAGLEFGLSTAELQFRTAQAPESASRTDGRLGPAYVVFLARPARFRFGRFNVTAFGLGFGSPLNNPGTKLRVQLDLLQIGFVL